MLNLPRILLMFELCMSGQALSIFLRSSRAQTINAFIGRLMCGLLMSCFSFWARMILAPNILAETREVPSSIIFYPLITMLLLQNNGIIWRYQKFHNACVNSSTFSFVFYLFTVFMMWFPPWLYLNSQLQNKDTLCGKL